MSSMKMIHAYWRERYPASTFAPFAILLAVIGNAAGGSLPTLREAVTGCVLAYVLVFAFRIADDLADLRSDRVGHPNRVLVQAASVSPIVVLALISGGGGILLILSQQHPGVRLALLAALSLFLWLWYQLRARFHASPLASAHAILIKYPAISLLTCAKLDRVTLDTALPTLGIIYLGLCLYEQLHDRAVRESRGGTWIFAAEVGLLVCIPLLMFSIGGPLR